MIVFDYDLDTVPNIVIEFHPTFSCLCSIGVSPIHGTLHIEFTPKEKLLEFEAFEDYIYTQSTKSFTVEAYAVHMFNVLKNELQPEFLVVKVDAETIKHGKSSVTITYFDDGEKEKDM